MPDGTTSLASTIKISQSCYQVLTAVASSPSYTITRQTGTDAANQVVVQNVLSDLFTGYDSTCNYAPISDVKTSSTNCVFDDATNSISCRTNGLKYSDTVTVTVSQANNNDITAQFSASLAAVPTPPGPTPGPKPDPTPTPAKKSKTTAIVLGVIGGIVGLGIVIGVAWYVIKGRQDADVDPYDEDATEALNKE